MMRVRVTRAFVEAYSTFNPGQELEVEDGRGVDLLRRGLAERLESIPETTKAPERGERAVHTRKVR
jgi:hypothetical protein